jgi:hypothetical protein
VDGTAARGCTRRPGCRLEDNEGVGCTLPLEVDGIEDGLKDVDILILVLPHLRWKLILDTVLVEVKVTGQFVQDRD